MPRVAQLYFKTAIIFLIIGVSMGLHMAIAGDHSAIGAHAHANLLGWVTMAIFGGYHALNPAKAERRIAIHADHCWSQMNASREILPQCTNMARRSSSNGPVVLPFWLTYHRI